MKKSLKLIYRKFFKKKPIDPVYGDTPDYSKGIFYVSAEGQIRHDFKCSCGCGQTTAVVKATGMIGLNVMGRDIVGLLLKDLEA